MKRKIRICICSSCMLTVFLLLTISCKKEKDNTNTNPPVVLQLPVITTDSVSNITQTTATSGGKITSQGSSPVIARGVCWSTSQNPRPSDAHTSDSNGIGTFTSNITGLSLNTNYYVRAYATNSSGTGYGNQIIFQTLGTLWHCGDTVIYSGKSYNTIQIGNQCWFKENLNIGTRIDTSQIPANNGIIEKYCIGNDETSCSIYGGLYRWDEIMQYTTTQGSKGICPSGWHIPTDLEWCTLTLYLDQTVDCNSTTSSGIDVGTKMKSTTGWANNGNGSNICGFTALPGGAINNGYVNGENYMAFFWSSTSAWYRALWSDDGQIFRGNADWCNNCAFSVRCLKD